MRTTEVVQKDRFGHAPLGDNSKKKKYSSCRIYSNACDFEQIERTNSGICSAKLSWEHVRILKILFKECIWLFNDEYNPSKISCIYTLHFYATANWNIELYTNARIAYRSSITVAKILRHHSQYCSSAIYIYIRIRRNKLSDERRQEISVRRKIPEIRRKAEEKEKERRKKRERGEKKRRKTVSRRKCNERARTNLYQPPEARGRRYGSRTTPDISDG